MEIHFIRSNLAKKGFRNLICGLTAHAFAGLSLAAEWSVEPSVSIRAQYDDNIRLTTAAHSSVWGTVLSPDVKFNRETETVKVTGGLKLNFNRYSGESGLDSDDIYLAFLSSYRGERNIGGLNIDFARDPTLLSELSETGVVQARRQRNQLVINPSWEILLTERASLKIAYTDRGTDYEDTSGTSLIDYRDQTASAGLQYTLTPRTTLSLTTYYDRFETHPASFKAETYGIQTGVDHQFSETLRSSLAVGLRDTQSTVAAQALVCTAQVLFGVCLGQLTAVTFPRDETSTGYTLNALLEERSEASVVSGRLSRDIYPTGVGALIETDAFSASWIKDLSATVKASVVASVYRSRYLGEVLRNSDSRYHTVQPRLTWRMSEWWTLEGGYNYSRAKSESSESATGNTVYVMLSYSWPKIAASR